MTDRHWGLIIISPMIIATAVMLMRQGALGLKGVLAIAVATITIATFLFVNQ